MKKIFILNTNSEYRFCGPRSLLYINLYVFEHTEEKRIHVQQSGVLVYSNHFAEYQKCDNCYEVLKDKIHTAIANGLWLDKQVENDFDRGIRSYEMSAYTNVHSLVMKLINPKEYWLKT